jgi:hypothetical protein
MEGIIGQQQIRQGFAGKTYIEESRFTHEVK